MCSGTNHEEIKQNKVITNKFYPMAFKQYSLFTIHFDPFPLEFVL